MCIKSVGCRALQNQSLKILLNDHVLDRGHGNFQKICVGSICEVGVNLPSLIPVESNKLVHEVLACLLPARRVALKVREAKFGDGARGNFGLEQIDFVQEQDKRGVLEPM